MIVVDQHIKRASLRNASRTLIGGLGLETYSISNFPAREAGGVTEMSEVVDVAEELVVQLREADHGDGAVLVEGPCVALQSGAEVSYMCRYLLNHHAPEKIQTESIKIPINQTVAFKCCTSKISPFRVENN